MDNRMNFHPSILQVASIIKNKDKIKNKEKTEMERKKRDRNANYSKDETNKLVELVLLKKDILENKKNGTQSWQEKKETWDKIEQEFNKSLSGDDVYRDSKTLKLKYESLKGNVKKKWNLYLKQGNNSKRKGPKFTAAEKKIKDMVLPTMEGICDFDIIDVSNGTKDLDDMSCSSDDAESDFDVNVAVKEDVFSEEDISNKDCSDAFREPPISREDPLVGIPNFPKRQRYNEETEKIKNRLQIEMFKEELEIKKLQRKMLEQDIEHKKVIQELEKEHLQLKIKVLKDL